MQQRDLGVTTIYVTHDQTEAMTLGHRVAVMKKGVLQQIAPPQESTDDEGEDSAETAQTAEADSMKDIDVSKLDPTLTWVDPAAAAERPFRYGDLFHAPSTDSGGQPLVSSGQRPTSWEAVLVIGPSCEIVSKADADALSRQLGATPPAPLRPS